MRQGKKYLDRPRRTRSNFLRDSLVYWPIPVSGDSNAAPLSPTTNRSVGLTLRLEDQRRFDKADRRKQISTRSIPCCGWPNRASQRCGPSVSISPPCRIRRRPFKPCLAVTEFEGSTSLDEIVERLGREGTFVRWIRIKVDAAHEWARNFDDGPRPGDAPNFFDRSDKIVQMLENITANNSIPFIVGERIGERVQVMNDVRLRSVDDVDSDAHRTFC